MTVPVRELADLLEKSAQWERELPKFLTEIKARIAASSDPLEKRILEDLVRSSEKFLSLGLRDRIMEFVPSAGEA